MFHALVDQWLMSHVKGQAADQVKWYDELNFLSKTDEQKECFDALAKALGMLVNVGPKIEKRGLTNLERFGHLADHGGL